MVIGNCERVFSNIFGNNDLFYAFVVDEPTIGSSAS